MPKPSSWAGPSSILWLAPFSSLCSTFQRLFHWNVCEFNYGLGEMMVTTLEASFGIVVEHSLNKQIII